MRSNSLETAYCSLFPRCLPATEHFSSLTTFSSARINLGRQLCDVCEQLFFVHNKSKDDATSVSPISSLIHFSVLVFTSLNKGALAIDDIPSKEKERQDDMVWFVQIYNSTLYKDLNISVRLWVF